MGNVKSVVSWFGGKNKMARQIINFMPRHKVYVEVFGGGGSVILNKKRVPLEVYNDINIGLVSLFRTLRDKQTAKEFQKRLQLTPYSREEFAYAKERWEWGHKEIQARYEELEKMKGDMTQEEFDAMFAELEADRIEDQIERARMFYVLCQQSFSAGLESWKSDRSPGPSKISPSLRRYLNGIDSNLAWAVERFRSIQIENHSYEYILDRYDSPDTLFYLDPPYIHSTRGRADEAPVEEELVQGENESDAEFDERVKNQRKKTDYHYEMTDNMHVDLVDRLLKLEGKFILSGYDHPIYDRLDDGEKFHKVKLDDFSKACQATKKGEKKDIGEEYLWINYNIEDI